jgi:transcriptional regulator with XRE-family HTH domain
VKHCSLKEARARRKWTQEQLADASGVDQSVISRIERGDVEDPQNSTVEALERALKVKRGTLIFGAQERIAS